MCTIFRHVVILVASFFIAGAAYGDGFAPGYTPIASDSNALPTIVTSLTLTCPPSGTVIVTGSGESTALSGYPGTAFIGLILSIARDSVATDNTNVVQSSALAFFDGDANRDFLNVQRVDACTPGLSSTYRLTAYRGTPDTTASSFVWNGRLTATEPAGAATGLIGTAQLADGAVTAAKMSGNGCAEGDVLVMHNGAWVCKSALPRFVDNGDGTVTDNQTGLMWEKKLTTRDDADCFSSLHGIFPPRCVENTYTWSVLASEAPSGTLYSEFLPLLNDLTRPDPGAGPRWPCFANHCDWRLPTLGELRFILSAQNPDCSSSPCIDPLFGPTQESIYWSSNTNAIQSSAWGVDFSDGDVHVASKQTAFYARAVRDSR